MRLEQLQAFLAVAETGNFQQAAQKCGITQSTISRQIKALEADLNVPLFYRSSQNKLTLCGERLLPHAQKIVRQWHSATSELEDLLVGRRPKLCVAAIHSVCAHFLPPVVHRFCQDYPDVQLRMTALGSERALKYLYDGQVDLALVMHNRILTTGPEMVMDVLYDEPIQVLMVANHPLAQYQAIAWAELARYPQVVFKEGYGMQCLVQEQFRRQGMELKIALELNTLDAFREVVRQGDLIALLPQGALTEARRDVTLAVRDIAPVGTQALANPPLTRQVVLVTTQDQLQIPPVRNFRYLVKKIMTPQL